MGVVRSVPTVLAPTAAAVTMVIVSILIDTLAMVRDSRHLSVVAFGKYFIQKAFMGSNCIIAKPNYFSKLIVRFIKI